IGATSRSKGVPQAVRDLTTPFPYNDLDALHTLFKAHPGEFAAVIMEPMSVEEPKPGYLAALAELVRAQGAVLIFDEIVTGFRYALGGAQDYFGITPDLAAFGKGMGNGMPISAVVGRADLMVQMEEIFFSATFGGESLSLAASLSVIDKMRREPVIETLWDNSTSLASAATALIEQFDLTQVMQLRGMAPWKVVVFEDHAGARREAIRTLWMREMIRHGVLTLGSHNICYAHDAHDLAIISRAWEKALGALRDALDSGALESNLPCPVIEPIFRVR
ncbi:MAG: aminotransferase class III-fold pyridoxal phosphate-dependent enzyme, partial [Alphaproteobacteria bacterium]|nr:aminotransferase class III-fold pyridoxal phosphate-dependent enzyme [Alphaproteobacteria bacterium]